jgi:DNA modification methylase
MKYDIYFGDSAETLEKIKANTFQLTVTSSPYWNVRNYGGGPKQIGFGQSLKEYLKSLDLVWKQVVRTTLPDGKIAINIGNVYYSDTNESRRSTANLSYLLWNQLNKYKKLRYVGTIYWRKTTSRDGSVLFGSYPYPSNFMISSAVEPIHVFRKIGTRKVSNEIKERSKVSIEDFRKLRNAIWDINGIVDKHCAAFPYELPERLIKMFSFYGDTVLDPFLGSGTTMKAARDLNRNCVGVELNYDYLSIIKEKVKINQNNLLHDSTFNIHR